MRIQEYQNSFFAALAKPDAEGKHLLPALQNLRMQSGIRDTAKHTLLDFLRARRMDKRCSPITRLTTDSLPSDALFGYELERLIPSLKVFRYVLCTIVYDQTKTNEIYAFSAA